MKITPLVHSLAALLLALSIILPRHAAAAPDNTQGMAMLAAFVGQTGELLDSAGAISATRTGTGVYNVVFNRDVVNCAFAPTVSRRDSVLLDLVSVSATIFLNANSAVAVRAFNVTGVPVDVTFQLLVFCNR